LFAFSRAWAGFSERDWSIGSVERSEADASKAPPKARQKKITETPKHKKKGEETSRRPLTSSVFAMTIVTRRGPTWICESLAFMGCSSSSVSS
jgi:hypothetical protein